MKLLAALGATTAAIVAVALVGAGPAHAATSVTVSGGGVSPTSATDTQISVTNNTGVTLFINTPYLTSGGVLCTAPCGMGSVGPSTYDIVAGTTAGVISFTNDPSGFDGPFQTWGTMTVTSTQAAPVVVTSTTSSGPAPVLQQFGKPVTGTCDETAPEDLNWAGVPAGGWSTAWGEWLHGGLGGWACSHTLSYSNAQAK